MNTPRNKARITPEKNTGQGCFIFPSDLICWGVPHWGGTLRCPMNLLTVLSGLDVKLTALRHNSTKTPGPLGHFEKTTTSETWTLKIKFNRIEKSRSQWQQNNNVLTLHFSYCYWIILTNYHVQHTVSWIIFLNDYMLFLRDWPVHGSVYPSFHELSEQPMRLQVCLKESWWIKFHRIILCDVDEAMLKNFKRRFNQNC